MKFLNLLSLSSSLLLLLTSVVQTSPTFDGPTLEKRKEIRHYECCPNPGWNISVINFEYTQDTKLYDHRGLTWKGFSGYKIYPGHADGWAPIPSNFTTAFATYREKGHELVFGSGSRSILHRVHSFWFYFTFRKWPFGPGTIVPIKIVGQGPNGESYSTVIYTDPYDDGVWEHVCLDWQPVEYVFFYLPSCWDYSREGCESGHFELDDIWVSASAIRPYKFPPPKEIYDF